jgi:hypothetical protein
MPGEFIARQGLISRGNVVVTGSLTTSGSLTTTGTITATTLVVQTITSSISSITGSTNFGSISDNTHTFTGSMSVSGSGTFTGALSGTSATFKVNADRNLAIKYDTNVTLSSQGDSGGPESLRVFADTFRIFTATSAAGLTERFTISNTGAATFTGNVSITKAAALLLLGNSTTNSYGAVQFLGNASGQGNTLGQFDFFNKISGTDVLSGQIEIAHDSSSANNKSYMALRVHNGTSLLTPLYISSDGVLDLAIGQIKFPASQNASANANTLDDYEEGTWTPTITAAGSNPSVTYNIQTGFYTKIGRQVFIQGLIYLSSKSGGSGQARISGLPFSPANVDQNFSVGTVGQMQGFSSTYGNVDGQLIVVRANQNDSYLSFYESYISNGSDWQIGNLGSTFIARFTISYFTA